MKLLIILLFLFCGCVTKPIVVKVDNSNYLVKRGDEIWTVKAIYIENRTILVGNQIFK